MRVSAGPTAEVCDLYHNQVVFVVRQMLNNQGAHSRDYEGVR